MQMGPPYLCVYIHKMLTLLFLGVLKGPIESMLTGVELLA
jgi:hypothetical protein